MEFIPDKISPSFIKIFRTYTWYLFKRRFHEVYLQCDYTPSPDRSTLFFLNHTSWWDGLIPFLLNEYIFRQNARAIMELKQVKEIRFFKWIGAYSIERDHPKSSMHTMQYTLDVLTTPRNSVYLYPQGKIESSHTPIKSEAGLGWLAKNLPENSDLVPGAILMHTYNSDKPTLLISIGEACSLDKTESRKSLTSSCEVILNQKFRQLVDDSKQLPVSFTKLM